MKTKRSVLLAVTLFALFHPLRALAQQTQQPTVPQQPSWDWPGPWHMWSGSCGFWWIFPLFMIFMIIICVAFCFFGHRSGGSHHHWGPWQMMDRPGPGRSWGDPTYSAIQILNERFAKGEIQQQEYEEKKAAILSCGQHK
ncbi:MAG: SHOCT domain-containing protein [Oryzomonas sp.]